MSSKRARIMVVALAAILVLTIVFGLVLSLLAPSARAEGTLDELRQNAQALADSQKQIQGDLDQLAQSKATAVQKKQALDQQISLTCAEIENTVQLINGLTDEIAKRQEALDAALREEARQTENFRQRIRLMEETGDAQYLGVLLQSDSFSDLLGRLSVVQDIVDDDQKMLDQLKAAREKVNAEKKALEQDKAEQEQVSLALSGKQAELEAQNAEQKKLLSEIESQEDELRKALDEQERQEREIQEQIQDQLEEIARKLAAERKQNVFVGGDFQWPCPAYVAISSPFGWRFHPILRENRFHSGVDMAASTGSKILAANDGTVVNAVNGSGGYGKYVVIDHGGGVATLYGHMSLIMVSAGQTVSRGETIGLVGSTGMSTGPHLHFEVMVNGSVVNPMPYIT